MPSLKEYVRSLFKLSGSQAMPGNSATDLTFPQSGQWFEGVVAPHAGYAVLSNGQAQVSELVNRTTGVRSRSASTANASVFVPVKKGDILAGMVSYTANEDARFCVVPLVGSS